MRYAIAASLIVHLLILWPDNSRLLNRDSPSPLQATLRAPPQAAIEIPPTLPAKPLPRVAPPAPSPVSLSRPADAPSLSESPRLPVVPQAATVAPEAPARPASGAPPPVAPATGIGALLTEPGATGEALDGLRGYRLAVAAQARRFKRYPAQATAAGWTGTADIRIEVGSDGRPHSATVARSSGHEVLDRAAVTMIDAGALRARLPDSLRGKNFAVVLPVVFNLDED